MEKIKQERGQESQRWGFIGAQTITLPGSRLKPDCKSAGEHHSFRAGLSSPPHAIMQPSPTVAKPLSTPVFRLQLRAMHFRVCKEQRTGSRTSECSGSRGPGASTGFFTLKWSKGSVAEPG